MTATYWTRRISRLYPTLSGSPSAKTDGALTVSNSVGCPLLQNPVPVPGRQYSFLGISTGPPHWAHRMPRRFLSMAGG